jgi:hypothetical protein
VDVLADGLWGGAFFGNRSSRQWRWAFPLGTAPDLIALGPFPAWQMLISGSAEFPAYVYKTYNVTHSLKQQVFAYERAKPDLNTDK